MYQLRTRRGVPTNNNMTNNTTVPTTGAVNPSPPPASVDKPTIPTSQSSQTPLAVNTGEQKRVGGEINKTPINASAAKPAVQNPTASPTQSTSGSSPWDDDDIPPVPVKSAQTVTGSLDNQPKENEKPFVVPENIEEKIGQKVPAANYVKSPVENLGVPNAAVPPVSSSQSVTPPATQPISSSNPALVGIPENSANKPVSPIRALLPRLTLVVPGLLVLLIVTTLLTEAGLLSLGVEKIYGAMGLEQVWGGLPSSTEKALAKSFSMMKSHPSYKIEGKLSMTIDGSVKSSVTSPLLSIITNGIEMVDQDVSGGIKAIKTQSDDDIYQYYPNSNTNVNSNSNLNSNANSNINSNLNTNSSNQNINVNSNSNANANTNSGTARVVNTGITNLTTTISAKSTSDSSEAVFKLSDADNSTLDLINQKDQLLLKTTGGVKYGNFQEGKWQEFKIDNLKDKNLSSAFFNVDQNSGLSVKGSRVGNEKVGDARCYVYQIESLEIGNAFSSLGITSDLVQTLSGQVWIGVKDKLVRRMTLKITTPVSSSVRLITVDITFKDFDVSNSITEVNSSQIITGTLEQKLLGDSKRKDDIDKILKALTQYKSDNKTYPVSNELLKLNSTSNIISGALVPRYLAEFPIDPKAADGWYYSYKSDGISCTMSAKLEDKTDLEGKLIGSVILYEKTNSY